MRAPRPSSAALLLACVAALALPGGAARADERRLRTDLPLDVVREDASGAEEVIGATPSADPGGVPLPDGDGWWLRPRREGWNDAMWRRLAEVVVALDVPGLDVSGVRFDASAAVALRDVTGLRRLDVRHATATGPVHEFVRRNRALRWLATDLDPAEPTLSRLPRLRHLVVVGSRDSLGDLAGLLELETLELRFAGRAPGALKGLSPLPRLSRLRLVAVDVGPRDLVALDRQPALDTVELLHCGIAPGALAGLRRVPRLRALRLDGTQLRAGDLAAVATASGIEVLGLAYCEGVTVQGLHALRALPGLRELDLSTSPPAYCCGPAAPAAGRWPEVPGRTLQEAALREIGRMPSLRRVVLREQPVSAEALARLRAALPACDVVWDPPPPR